jgi:hypothetical protein
MNARLKTIWICLLLAVGHASVSFGANSFVLGFRGVDVLDSTVDILGTTYLLGNDTNGCLLRKFDSAGAKQKWTSNLDERLTISNLTAVGMCSAPGLTNTLFVIGQDGANHFRIVRVDSDSGNVTADASDSSGTFAPKGVTFAGTNVYVCGNYTGFGNNVFNLFATRRGSQSALVMKLTSDLSTNAVSLNTFGGDQAANIADSVAVDETGAVYVGGYCAPGVFTLDGNLAANGLWHVDVVYSSADIGSISTATNVLAGSNASRTNTSYYSTINFSSGSGYGDFGGDLAFPGGGGNNFVVHASGTIWVPATDSYVFRSTTDDGTRITVDNTIVVDVPNPRSTGSTDGTITLTRGLHAVDYVMYQQGGDASAELAWKRASDSSFSLLVPTKVNDTRNKAYVFKFDSGMISLQDAYLTVGLGAGLGGEYHEVHYAQGWIYAVGFWRGQANNPSIGLPDNSINGSADIDIVKLDTGLALKGRATVKGVSDNDGYSISSDEIGNVYVTGSYGPASVDFVGNGDRSTLDPSQDGKFTSLSAPGGSLFVAKLNSSMDYQWVDHPIGSLPDYFYPSAKARWNPVLQRLIWTGSFVAQTGSLTLGQPTTPVTLNGSQGFLAVIDPDGNFSEQVLLTIISDYGISGVQVLPFGGPLDGGNPTQTNQEALIKGAQITASVPPAIYLNQGTNVSAEANADTRIRATGYSVDNNVPTGGATSYTFVLSKDTTVQFNWTVDFALTVDVDDQFAATKGSGDVAHGITGIAGLTSLASGNPDPTVQKHWIAQNERVIASIDSEVIDQNYPGLPVKYVVTGYWASGPANSLNATQSLFFPFSGSDIRRQVPQFVMSAPASILYHWKLKIGVQVDTTGLASRGYPLVLVTQDGATTNLTVTQSNGVGVGTFWYDEHTKLEIGSLLNQGVVQLQGWYNGDGINFNPDTGSLSNLDSSFTYPAGGTNGNPLLTYASHRVVNLVRPARVMWNYGDRIFEETVYIGNYVTFSTINDPAVRSTMRTDLQPDPLEVVSGPSGSTINDMSIWDPAGKKLYPLRPGTLLSYWQTTGDPDARVILRLNFLYQDPHYHHIANTPPVVLDPATNDLVSFDSLKYTEPTTGATVDNSGRFSATGPGKTVLLFKETSSAGRSGTIQTLRVRMVETKLWDTQLPAIQTAVIGQKITSPYDTAGLGTGYTMFTNARYNANIYSPQAVTGPIIPVNLNPSAAPNERLVIVWYENRDKILWPYQAVRYEPAWPTVDNGLNRIVIASRFGNECVAQSGSNQVVAAEEMIGTNDFPAELAFNPVRFQQLQIYQQPVRGLPGYNPNEEHALLAPSLRSAAVSPQPMAVYALRDGDLNVTNRDTTYTSDPYVLVQFFDALHNQFEMRVFSIERTATNLNAGDLSYSYGFSQNINAGEPAIPFYPLPAVIGATPCDATYGKDGQPNVQRCFWRDHKATPWCVSGDSFFTMYFYYPLAPDFYWPAADGKLPGDCVAFLPDTPAFAGTHFFNSAGQPIDYRRNDQVPTAQAIVYNSVWPDNLPLLKVGETLTFPGGEYHSDNPVDLATSLPTPGLPGSVGWASGEIVYDSKNPLLLSSQVLNNYSVRMYQALEQRTSSLDLPHFPPTLLPATQRTKVVNGDYIFVELSASLQKRVIYDPINGQLVFQGFLNDKSIGDPTLTASPPQVYVLEPNIMTAPERDALLALEPSNPNWVTAVQNLYIATRNPNGLDMNGDGSPDDAYDVGVKPQVARDQFLRPIHGSDVTAMGGIQAALSALGFPSSARGQLVNDLLVILNQPVPTSALGPGLAVTANPAFLDPFDPTQLAYVTLVENNDDSLGSAPVVLHIIKVDKTQRYRGAIKTILSANVFDENIVLRHTGDFGGHADDLVFEWWYRPEDGTDAATPDRQGLPTPWKLFADPSGNQGKGFYQLTLKGNPTAPEALLADTLFFVRYRHKNEVVQGINWEVPQPNGEQRCAPDCKPGIPYDWAGAGNSLPPNYLPQLAEGWIKRVLDRINIYEARIDDFSGSSPATYSSIIRELGAKYEGPVALNQDKNVIENVGLIALYETILQRGRSLSIDLSTPISTPAIANALELVSTRLSDFYQLLGNEAYSDALNPTIGYGSDSVDYGELAPSVFAFENQMATLLDEELALLRGQDAYFGAPVYNRLFWNFTHAEGEAAYVMNYDIGDVNSDGFIDVNDAMIMYPQGHGDAWGHYLTSLTKQYDLLRHPYFNWVSRSEYLNIQDIVVPVDYLDERKFAQAAAAKAKAGADIVNSTYRQKFVADPTGQWQGYTDTDTDRAWGVEEWARRAGQGAYFDWVTANALLPSVHPNTNYTGIQKVDRTTVQDISQIAANLTAIQSGIEHVNSGNNPVGLANGALVFDLDPTFLQVGSTAQIGTRAVQGLLHFDQVYERALAALVNAKAAWDNANQFNNMVRQMANTEQDFQNEVFQQDLSYRNQLIEIFGSPYAGTIGTGKAYPAGYQGPDTMLYMYVAVNNVNNNTVPQPTPAYFSNYLQQISSTKADINSFGNSSTATIIGAPNTWYAQYNLTFLDPSQITNSVAYSDFSDTNHPPQAPLPNLNLPVMASGYSFVAPAEWGRRDSPGELQDIISQLVQAQADLNTALYDWDNAQELMIQNLELLNAKVQLQTYLHNNTRNQIIVDGVLGAVEVVLHTLKTIVDNVGNTAKDFSFNTAEFVPKNLPTAGLSFSPGDALSPARGSALLLGTIAKTLGDTTSEGFNNAAEAVDLGKQIGDAIFALQADDANANYDLIQTLLALQYQSSTESNLRVAIFKQVQVLRQVADQYLAKLGEGNRLIQERTAYNKRVAAQAQRDRYQDLSFRVARNAALEKYRSAFDLAARYAYLAATAYDYDLNLAHTDPGSPVDILGDIVKQRLVGILNVNNQPAVGGGGLAEDLAILSANYNLLKTRMGLNNPQIENVSFSLRSEAFRILSDTNSDPTWQAFLRSALVYKQDLWQVPEFRTYCRPFTSASNGPQPGLVIPLSTQIVSGKNFFGWPLAGGDNTYDPTLYATKINSVGVWFASYDTVNLPQTPRVYLVPAGADVMTIPNSPNLAPRFWNVLDQNIPVPFPSSSANLSDPTWKPLTDSLNGTLGETRMFSSFRAFGFDHDVLTSDDSNSLLYDARLVARSTWNTKWLLIIPGATLNADPNAGLDAFINSVRDINLVINSYAISGN